MAETMIDQARKAKLAARSIRSLSLDKRNAVLLDFADGIISSIPSIVAENQKDVTEAEKNGLSEAMIDRLRLDEKRLRQIAEGVRQVAELPDPLRVVLEERDLSSGLYLKKVSSAIGVIGIIFESRPNVSADCAALCFKAGSSCVLKGGRESYRSCLAIINVMKEALRRNGISEDAVMLGEKPSHEETEAFMAAREYVDLLIPRGGKNLIRSVVEHAKVPVIETGAGVCHVYVDEGADLDMAVQIILNAKCSRPSVCNAMETLLIHEKEAAPLLAKLGPLLEEKGVAVYGDEETCRHIQFARPAASDAWYIEYNDMIMNCRIVKDVGEAIDHIEKYGTHHSESIISENSENVFRFMNEIDSACLYHNASTRFTDGFEFGLGAEIGISTQKLHARGPMGLRELTTYTYLMEGKGEIR